MSGAAEGGRSGSAPGTMHWSYPAAIRFLRVLCARGWRATTWSIDGAYRTAAVHSDAASLRSLFREMGVENWQGSVGCDFVGWSGEPGDWDRRRIHRYSIPERLQALARRLLRHELANPTPRGTRPDLAFVMRGVEGQVALF